eukprot:CAMPEP_0119307990 /NCGR_PEP_ID=MMETSP1333-20130426/8331_1 /TAXON_ID=418940 /ORGANISM="Scyphosphaera apsteinii, Strain RCC1455" /LENGTH=85 /DNA_ID=CAMNT_0007311659 /DNA_START=663 /DNA_END=917 /DNA_ORIENTATION=+
MLVAAKLCDIVNHGDCGANLGDRLKEDECKPSAPPSLTADVEETIGDTARRLLMRLFAFGSTSRRWTAGALAGRFSLCHRMEAFG